MIMPSETTSNDVIGGLKRLGPPRAARRGVSCPTVVRAAEPRSFLLSKTTSFLDFWIDEEQLPFIA